MSAQRGQDLHYEWGFEMRIALVLCFDESDARLDTRSFCYRKHLGESHLGCQNRKADREHND